MSYHILLAYMKQSKPLADSVSKKSDTSLKGSNKMDFTSKDETENCADTEAHLYDTTWHCSIRITRTNQREAL